MPAFRIRLQRVAKILFFSSLIAAISPVPLHSATKAVKFEIPGNQSASVVLDSNYVSGPHFRVRDKVVSYGYMRHYYVDSDYGPFEVTGDFALRKLVREIYAITSLQETKKGEAYLKGLKKAASQPVEFGMNLITDPVDTVSGIPKGIAGLFQNVKTGLSSKSKPGDDSKLEQALAVSANKRDLADRLGVDVYSSNSVLQKELNSVAWTTTLGSLTLSAALAPVGGPAVAAVSGARAAQQVRNVLKEYPPQRLRQMNQEKLQAMGVQDFLTTQFLDHPSYTPSRQTIIVQCLETMSGAKGRSEFIETAIAANDEESASFFQYVAETMKGYHLQVSPILDIKAYGPMVFARTSSGTVLVPFPLDHGVWTERAADRIPPIIETYKTANRDMKKCEVWVTGTVSPLAKQELGKLGLQVVEDVDKRIEFVY